MPGFCLQFVQEIVQDPLPLFFEKNVPDHACRVTWSNSPAIFPLQENGDRHQLLYNVERLQSVRFRFLDWLLHQAGIYLSRLKSISINWKTNRICGAPRHFIAHLEVTEDFQRFYLIVGKPFTVRNFFLFHCGGNVWF
jgi:hypothetical protein